jgi:hypothetical protein
MSQLIKFSRDERPEGSGLVFTPDDVACAQSVSTRLQSGIRFLPHPLPAPHSLTSRSPNPRGKRYGLALFHLDDLVGRVLFLRRQRCLPMTEESKAPVPAAIKAD